MDLSFEAIMGLIIMFFSGCALIVASLKLRKKQ